MPNQTQHNLYTTYLRTNYHYNIGVTNLETDNKRYQLVQQEQVF